MSLEFTEIRIMTQENYQEISPLGDKSIPPNVSLLDKISKDKAKKATNKTKRCCRLSIHKYNEEEEKAKNSGGDNG